MNSQYQIFISYRRNPSSVIAGKLFETLEAKGYSVFFDRTSLQAGCKFLKRINEAIDSCSVFIVFLSKATLDSSWVHHEVRRALTRTKDDSIYILPIIFDDSLEKDYYPSLFRKKDIDGDISFYRYDGCFDELYNAIIKAIEYRQVYPPKETSDDIKRIQQVRENIKAIPDLISGVINECKSCPRFSAKEGQIRCPFLFARETSDNTFLDTQASLRVPVSKRPEITDYSFLKYKSDCSLWNDERDAIKNELRIQVGDGHLGCSLNLACERQQHALIRLQKSLRFLNRPIYQTDLDYLSSRIKSLSSSFNEEDLNILKKFDISDLLMFVLYQVQRCWHTKEWSINYLVKINGYDSLAALILGSIHESTKLLEHAVQEKTQINTIKPFLILWWILRQNSSILTKAILSKASPTVKNQLITSIEFLLDAYQKLSDCPDQVQFKHALQFPKIDFPEEMQSTATDSLCLPKTDYKWITIKDPADPYFSLAVLDNCQNPINWSRLYLSRCANELEMFNIYTVDDDEYCSLVYDYHNVYAIDYIFPLYNYCLQLKASLRNKETYEIDLYSPTPKIISLLATNNFNAELLYIPSESFDSDFQAYTIAAFDHNVNKRLFADCKQLEKRERSVEDVLNSNDLSAIIYLANILAFSYTPDYENAIRLYEKAISMGACFCMFRIAQCFEVLHNYQRALWWYMTVDEESVDDKETLYLRIGTCCYHLNEMALCHEFYDKAGAKGQAAKYKYNLYSETVTLESFYAGLDLKSSVFNKAMGELLDEVKPRLGLFEDLHDFQMESNDQTVDLAIKTKKDLQKKALNNDAEAQYKLGLYEIEAFIASEMFVDNAFRRIKVSANNGNPHALCLMGLYMERFKHNPSASEHYYNAAFDAVYPTPFPDISRLEI